MANYQLEQTGAEVQALLNAVESPDTTPAAGSSNLITSGAVQAAVAGVSAEVTALGHKVGNEALVNLLQSGMDLEQGGLLSGGGNNAMTNNIRTSAAIKTPSYLCVPAGYKISRVSYYSAWSSIDSFTLATYVDVNNQSYVFDTTYPLVRFAISKSGADFKPEDFLAAFSKDPLARFDTLESDILSSGRMLVGNTRTNGNYSQITKIPSGTKVKNLGSSAVRLTNTNSNGFGWYQSVSIASGSEVTLSFDASFIRADSGNASVAYKLLVYKPDEVLDYIRALIKEASIIVTAAQFEFVTNPARLDGSSSSSGAFRGYKIDLSGLYDKGIRGIVFRGAVMYSPATGNSVIPGYIYGSNGIENKASIGTDPAQGNGWYYLPILSTSQYLLASYNYSGSYGTAFTPEAAYLIDEKNAANLEAPVSDYDGSGARASAASLAAGSSLSLSDFPTGNEKGLQIGFGCKFSAFSSLRIGAGYNATYSRWFVIDGTNIALYKDTNTGTADETQAHGLTMTTMLNININIDDDGAANVMIQTEAGYFQYKFTGWGYFGCGTITATSVGGTLTDCELSASIADISSPVWFIGASYETPNLYWVSWAKKMGYFNYLINAKPGRNSHDSFVELKKLLKLGRPKFLVWTMFGNDGTATTFADYIEIIKDLCVGLHIVPVVVSRPDTPTQDYADRRAAVIASGLRYVDEQAALQKTLYASGGEWYDGFLGPDGIHPTDAGSRAIAMQFIKDFPEIMTCK